MWINRVELQNIKSYGPPTTIELTAGVNAICGQNGAGKSTVLEAIGLALFGQSTYKNRFNTDSRGNNFAGWQNRVR